MSNFFDNLGKAVTNAANSVSTGINAAAQEQRLKEAYQVLGRMYYESVRAGNPTGGEAFDRQMAKIDDLIAAIRELRCNQNIADV